MHDIYRPSIAVVIAAKDAARYVGAMAGLGGGGEVAGLLGALVWTPANVAMVGACAVVAFGMPRTAALLRTLTVWKAAASVVLLVVSLCVMFAQGFNPFLYFQF